MDLHNLLTTKLLYFVCLVVPFYLANASSPATKAGHGQLNEGASSVSDSSCYVSSLW